MGLLRPKSILDDNDDDNQSNEKDDDGDKYDGDCCNIKYLFSFKR